MSLWDRCVNLFLPRVFSVALTPTFVQVNKIRWELGLPGYRSPHDIHGKARMLVNTAFGFELARPLPPIVDMVGAVLPPGLEEELARDEDAWRRVGGRWDALLGAPGAAGGKGGGGKKRAGGKKGAKVKVQETGAGASPLQQRPPAVASLPRMIREWLEGTGYVKSGSAETQRQKQQAAGEGDGEKEEEGGSSKKGGSRKTGKRRSPPPASSSSVAPAVAPAVVYVSLGTMAYVKRWQVKALIAGLTHPNIRVLWTAPLDQKNALPLRLPR
jgi:hypothetical protein